MSLDYGSGRTSPSSSFRIVDAVAREGSAGARLTRPAVSRALAAAEDRLGSSLFVREGRGMSPTPTGRSAVETARRVLQAVDRLHFDLEALRHDRRGRLRIATECYTCYPWLSRVVASFRSEFPGFELEIVPDATYETL